MMHVGHAVEVILAAPKNVPKEEKLYVERPGFGKVSVKCNNMSA